MPTKPIVLVAGGTGGHLFPAEALADILCQRGFEIELITDERAHKYSLHFSLCALHVLASATPYHASLSGKMSSYGTLVKGLLAARKLIKKISPAVIVGFGGYPTVPPILAATYLGIPAILHEQNSVMGRANRFLSKRAKYIAAGFACLKGFDSKVGRKIVHIGNPVRAEVLEAAKIPFPDFEEGALRVLVTGGSQGAHIMAEVVPLALDLLSKSERGRLRLTCQVRSEDLASFRSLCEGLGVRHEIASFFSDLPHRIAQAHLVIGRAGALTVSELAIIGRPSILVPLPHSLDQDQATNARYLAESHAAKVVAQSDFSPEWLANELRAYLQDYTPLIEAAHNAKNVGIGDAAHKLADLVAQVAQDRP